MHLLLLMRNRLNSCLWNLSLKVLEAHRQGFTSAVGYELNPWLVRLARFHAWRAGHHGNVSYRREDLWKVWQFLLWFGLCDWNGLSITANKKCQVDFWEMLVCFILTIYFFLSLQVDLTECKNITVFLAPSVVSRTNRSNDTSIQI